MFGLENVATNQVGELNGKKHFHYPFRLNNVDIFNKHHKSLYHKEGDYPPEFKRLNQKVYRSVTNDMNNLMNFNPTRGSEKQQFEDSLNPPNFSYFCKTNHQNKNNTTT